MTPTPQLASQVFTFCQHGASKANRLKNAKDMYDSVIVSLMLDDACVLVFVPPRLKPAPPISPNRLASGRGSVSAVFACKA